MTWYVLYVCIVCMYVPLRWKFVAYIYNREL